MKLTSVYDCIWTRGHTLALSNDDVIRTLTRHKVTYLLNVAQRCDDSLQREMNAPGTGMIYLHRPLSDGMRIQRELVEEPISWIVQAVQRRVGIVVHCDAGRNRTGLVVAIAVIRLTGNNPADVLSELRRRRPGLLANSHFEKYILESPHLTRE